MEQQNTNLQSFKIISLALHAAILIMTGVLFFLANTEGWVSEFTIKPENTFLFYAMVAAAGVSVLLVVTWPIFTLNPPTTMEEAATYYAEREKSPLDRIFYDFSKPTQVTLTKTLLRMAGCESIVLFGFVAAFLNQSAIIVVPFAIIGLILQFIFGPIYGLMRKGSL